MSPNGARLAVQGQVGLATAS